MWPADFKETNTRVGHNAVVPEGVPAYQGYDNAGGPFTLTAWQPNADDIKAINEGRPIMLSVTSFSYPPLVIYTLDENGDLNTLINSKGK